MINAMMEFACRIWKCTEMTALRMLGCERSRFLQYGVSLTSCGAESMSL